MYETLGVLAHPRRHPSPLEEKRIGNVLDTLKKTSGLGHGPRRHRKRSKHIVTCAFVVLVVRRSDGHPFGSSC